MKDKWINKIHCGDNIELLKQLPEESVDCVITSPPYWGLRFYGECNEKIWGGNPNCEHDWGESHTRHQEAPGKTSLVKQKGLEYTVTTHTCTKCGAWKGQFGLEPHPNMYIEHLVEICREIYRVLKKTGSFYLNLGDSYYNSPAGNKELTQSISKGTAKAQDIASKKRVFRPDGKWLRPKQLLLVPTRAAAALQEDGWILRNDLIWAKPNPMPTSVVDRLNNTYEHIFFFVKNENYFFDLDVIREKPSTGVDYTRKASGVKGNEGAMNRQSLQDISNNPLGKNPGDVVGYTKDIDKQNMQPGDRSHFRSGDALGKAYDGKEVRGNPLGKNPGDVHTFESVTIDTELEKIKDDIEYHINKIFFLAKQRKRETYGGKYSDCGEGKDGKSTQEYLVSIRKTADEYIKENKLTGKLAKVIKDYAHGYAGNPAGRNPGDIFTITVQPFSEAHFAVFPPDLARKPLISSCPKEICTECGSPRERILEDVKQLTPKQEEDLKRQREKQQEYIKAGGGRGGLPSTDLISTEKVTVGWTECKCKAPFAPGVVLDPFNGSGTTCLVAKQEGRRYIGFDINPDYCEMARNRISKVINVDEWGGKNYNYPLKSYTNAVVQSGEIEIDDDFFGGDYKIKTELDDEETIKTISKDGDGEKEGRMSKKEFLSKDKKEDEEIDWEI